MRPRGAFSAKVKSRRAKRGAAETSALLLLRPVDHRLDCAPIEHAGNRTVLAVKGHRSVHIGQVDRLDRMRRRFVHRAGRLVDEIARARRPAAIIDLPREYVEVGGPKMRMRLIDLALGRLDQRAPRPGLLADAQHLELIAGARIDPFLLVGAHERRIERIEIHLYDFRFLLFGHDWFSCWYWRTRP